MAVSRPPARRRRARRGSVERPVNGRLYRSAFLILSLPLLLAAFTVARPAPLQAPLLPPTFDEQTARGLAEELATRFPARAPGSSGALGAAQWLRDELANYGLTTQTETWREQIPGVGRVRLQNLTATVAGQSPDTIVVVAHRDDTGEGPGANDNGSGTAALIELARAYAQPATSSQRGVRTAHTIQFVSTDGGAFGALGAARLAEQAARGHVIAIIDLDAMAGAGAPRVEIAGDRPRSPSTALVQTAAQRILEQTGSQPRHPGFLGQLIDLAFPFSLYEQAPLVGRGVPALTLTTAGSRPPEALGDSASRLRSAKLGQMGRSAQSLLASIDQSAELAQGTTSYVWVGDRMIRGWSLQLVLIALLVPFLVAVVDLFARGRRRRLPLVPAWRSLRSRLAFWGFVGLLFYLFGLAGAWPAGAPRPPNPATAAAGDWPVLALCFLAVLVLAGWLLVRQRLVPRRRITAEEELAGYSAALLALGVTALLVVATNPFALLFVLPALHAWLWLPQLRTGRTPARAFVFLVGLAGPALVLLSLALRFGLGFDAPWYLLELVALHYVGVPPVAITLAGAAAASQLAAAAAGRYAPYPEASERGPRGPVRELVRAVALALRNRRRVVDERRRAIPGGS